MSATLSRLRRACAAALTGVALLGAALHAHGAEIAGGRYGKVTLTEPAGAMHAFVVLFSSRAGWQPADQQAADLLARHGALVVGVDSEHYAATLAASNERCHQLVGDTESLSHQLQREQHSDHYYSPIVAGTGLGGTLAAQMLAQAAANTLAGAAALDPEASPDPRLHPCPPDPTISRGTGLPGFMASGVTGMLTGGFASHPAGGVSGNPAPAATQSFPAGTSRAAALLALLAPHLQAAEGREDDVSDLPLIELPPHSPGDKLAIVISGDGGWRDLDKSIAEALQKNGVAVIGIDSLRYFWRLQTPQHTAHDVARIIQYYGRRWHTRQVALIGYSFGADVMPFIYNRLPASLRGQVNQITLLGFTPTADFQIRVTGWLGMPASKDALPVAAELAKVPPALLQCFYGEEETDTACPTLLHTGADVIRTAGGHHFGRDYNTIEQSIMDDWRKHPGNGAAAAAP